VQWVDPGTLAAHTYWKHSPNALLRFHIGLEDIDDLIDDLKQAANYLPRT
jgi:cystathionine beta-lyase/cystathionine gamma-synthase